MRTPVLLTLPTCQQTHMLDLSIAMYEFEARMPYLQTKYRLIHQHVRSLYEYAAELAARTSLGIEIGYRYESDMFDFILQQEPGLLQLFLEQVTANLKQHFTVEPFSNFKFLVSGKVMIVVKETIR